MKPVRTSWRRLISWSALGLVSCLVIASPAAAATGHQASAGQGGPYLLGVWCSGPHQCLAVGTGQHGGAASVVWNGRSWKNVTVPHRGLSLTGLACVSWKLCLATGSFGTVDEWDGSAWHGLPTPYSAALESVSCPGPHTCVAVGKTDYQDNVTGAIRWNGKSWLATPVPRPADAIRSDLRSVSCTSTTNCLAVGTYYTGSQPSPPLAATWNGSAWKLVAGPPEELDGVSCVRKTWCMAVGFDHTAFWDGSAWTTPPAHYPFFRTAVSCLATTFCASIGVTAIRWTGRNWLWFKSLPGSFYGFAVWCGSSSDCMAVGASQPDTAQWDGRKWHGHLA
jgi:uncharacterized membrane protein